MTPAERAHPGTSMSPAGEELDPSLLGESRWALFWGLLAAGLLTTGIYFGSRGFKDFDTALVPYAWASVFTAFGLAYRYAMWLTRPPTRLYWWQGWRYFLEPRRLAANLAHLFVLVLRNLVAQNFIRQRSRLRWAAHGFIMWGCVLAGAVTFPLSFGWIRFETPRDAQDAYETYAFGVRLFRFPLDGVFAGLVFHVLVVSAVLVLIGVFLSLWRRARGHDALALQQFANDLLPLILLFAISVTGLLLTVSAHFLRGFHYPFLSQFHALTVIFTLLYLPFGKFFHIFQRPAQLSIDFYKRAGARGEQAKCMRCSAPFDSLLHITDLTRVERELGIRYELESQAHYQSVCPPCRRKTLALAQGELWLRAGRGPLTGAK
jgi:nitrate reductase gamma subunit